MANAELPRKLQKGKTAKVCVCFLDFRILLLTFGEMSIPVHLTIDPLIHSKKNLYQQYRQIGILSLLISCLNIASLSIVQSTLKYNIRSRLTVASESDF